MDETEVQGRLSRFERVCRERGLPVTSQRRAILEAVLRSGDHPTADRIHERVARRRPTVSRTTVYRSLDALVDLGLIGRACHPGHTVRFDPRIDDHHHLICLRCGLIVDLPHEGVDPVSIPDTSHLDFEVWDHRIQFRGICRDCRAQEEHR